MKSKIPKITLGSRKKGKLFKEAKKVASLVDQKKKEYRVLTNDQLRQRIDFFSQKIINKELIIEEIIIDALAMGREIAFRTHKLFAYHVQIMGAFIISNGDFAEMKTGEGKTLTILIAAFVAALSKRGVHIVTVNEYLVKRDAEFTRVALEPYGITVGYNVSSLQQNAKREMFSKDITYTTNSELGFDYLRDNMVSKQSDKSIRELAFAIIDEGDSILIDEARTPLIISGQPNNDTSMYVDVDRFIKKLLKQDYAIDVESNTISLNESGTEKASIFFKVKNIYSIESSDIIHKIQNSLMSNFIFKNGTEYLVVQDKIQLIDSFTGRVLEGHSYNAGLQQAIQAKEEVTIEPENRIMATITYQSLFRMYKKLSALSGTAFTEREEFLKIYNLIVVQIPTNQQLIRKDNPDYIFGKKPDKWKHVVADIVERNKKGQPVLIGTSSVNDSEHLATLLEKINVKYEILNAKNNQREAEIISHAGDIKAITISTNMAGRGTDIKIKKEVVALGGLYVIGTERNESRRIDDQLRGRSGRQGDPGETRFYTSLQDSLFKRFATDRFDKAAYKLQNDDFFDSLFFSRFLSRTQKKIEGINFDVRRNIIDYDHVLSSQRELIYKQRDQILKTTNAQKIIEAMIKESLPLKVLTCRSLENSSIVDRDKFAKLLNNEVTLENYFQKETFKNLTLEQAEIYMGNVYHVVINLKFQLINQFHRQPEINSIIISNIDYSWTNHLEKMSRLRESANLRSYEQKSPLNIYTEEGTNYFNKMKKEIVIDVTKNFSEIILPNYLQFIMPQLEKNFVQRKK